ncbi:MAG: phage tail sheath family protein [Mesorhizobium sp.]|nr:MAG: phage tail sheath family protein [Mesorhizobium sp.]TIX16108.1 MAG: phage tail sheath family protein [Mesorhizobium sp.]TJW08605.1 MAG: phage tail sheath family protein [Mesorhizobium sp.]
MRSGIDPSPSKSFMPMPPVEFVDTEQFLTFLKRAIDEDTQWVVFEPNNEVLWERVKDKIHSFLRAQWRASHLKGLTEDEAFTIVCDRSSMTQDDILNGRLICEIGVAPVRPAEFVIFRLLQNTADAQV